MGRWWALAALVPLVVAQALPSAPPEAVAQSVWRDLASLIETNLATAAASTYYVGSTADDPLSSGVSCTSATASTCQLRSSV